MLKTTAAAIFNLYSKVNVRISVRTQPDTHPAFWELVSKKLIARQLGYITPWITEAASSQKALAQVKILFKFVRLYCWTERKKELFIYLGQPPAVPRGAGAAPMCPGTQLCNVQPSAAAQAGVINDFMQAPITDKHFFSRILAASTQEFTLEQSASKTFLYVIINH